MVGKIGFEPTQTEANGFTVRPNSPTFALAHIRCRLSGMSLVYPGCQEFENETDDSQLEQAAPNLLDAIPNRLAEEVGFEPTKD